jgi:hypothetical protein
LNLENGVFGRRFLLAGDSSLHLMADRFFVVWKSLHNHQTPSHGHRVSSRPLIFKFQAMP